MKMQRLHEPQPCDIFIFEKEFINEAGTILVYEIDVTDLLYFDPFSAVRSQ